MSNLELPKELRKQVIEYIQNTHFTLDRQSELEDFMRNISPSFKVQVSCHIFRGLATQNDVLKNVITAYIEKTPHGKLTKEEQQELAITKFVSKLEIKLSMPEDVIVKQEDLGEVAHNEKGHMCMFFIAKGSCNVLVQTRFVLDVFTTEADSIKFVRRLEVGDHFGEISLLYNCKRSATVVSNNYCTLASLAKPDFLDLYLQFDSMKENFKKQVISYDDELKVFVEKECNKIAYFK